VLTKKNDSGEVLSGARYGLYNSSKKLLKTAVTDDNGKAKFDYDLLPNTNYYVKEITAPEGYALNNEYHLVNRANTAVNDLDNFQNAKLSDHNYSVTDKPFTLKLELNKYNVLNDIKIEGVTFDISLNGKVVKSITTDIYLVNFQVNKLKRIRNIRSIGYDGICIVIDIRKGCSYCKRAAQFSVLVKHDIPVVFTLCNGVDIFKSFTVKNWWRFQLPSLTLYLLRTQSLRLNRIKPIL